MTNENTTITETTAPKMNGKQPSQGQPRVINNPNDVASLVLMQIDAINAKKDDLTIAIKGLTDLTKQLAQAYASHTRTIQELMERVKGLEDNAAEK